MADDKLSQHFYEDVKTGIFEFIDELLMVTKVQREPFKDRLYVIRISSYASQMGQIGNRYLSIMLSLIRWRLYKLVHT
jgi:hypothetical protein